LQINPRSIVIRIQSDELYQNSDEIAVEETWLPILDQVGNTLFADGEPKFDIYFAANSTSEKNAYAFSAERADYVLRYFERKYRFRLDQGKYRVAGLGKTSEQVSNKTLPFIEIILKPEGEQ
jgi:flagellar motor protein MotB